MDNNSTKDAAFKLNVDLIDMGIIPAIIDNYVIIEYDSNKISNEVVINLLERYIGRSMAFALPIDQHGLTSQIKIKKEWLDHKMDADGFKILRDKLTERWHLPHNIQESENEDNQKQIIHTYKKFRPFLLPWEKMFQPLGITTKETGFSLEDCESLCKELNLVINEIDSYTPGRFGLYYSPTCLTKGGMFIPVDFTSSTDEAFNPAATKTLEECQKICDVMNEILRKYSSVD